MPTPARPKPPPSAVMLKGLTPEDFEAIGRAMAAVLAVDIDEES